MIEIKTTKIASMEAVPAAVEAARKKAEEQLGGAVVMTGSSTTSVGIKITTYDLVTKWDLAPPPPPNTQEKPHG